MEVRAKENQASSDIKTSQDTMEKSEEVVSASL